MLVRSIFLAAAILLPASWTVAKAADAPAGDTAAEGGAKKEKKAKKSKKGADDADKKAGEAK
jgi:hypothetical protein